MRRLPALFELKEALQMLADRTDILPAVGGATEDELRPHVDEVDDERATRDDKLLDEPYEFGNTSVYVPLTPLRRHDQHLFRYFQDGSMRSFFVGTALEHERQTPVIIGQVGCAAIERDDDGRLRIAEHDQRHLLLLAFSQISQEVRDSLEAIIARLGAKYEVANIEAYGQEGQDLRRRAEDTMRATMHRVETEMLLQVLTSGRQGWLIYDGSLRFAKFFEELRHHYGSRQPPVTSVAKSFSKAPRFKIGRGARAREVNLWQLLSELPEGHRTIAYKSKTSDRIVSVWYVRLRMKSYMEYPLMGVIKVELPVLGGEAPPSELITQLSNALLAERTVTPHGMDRRWHAHLYPVFQAERCVKNAFVNAATLRAGFNWPHRAELGGSV